MLKLFSKISLYDRSVSEDKINFAFNYDKSNHIGQFRETGEDYFTHPLAVAFLLTELKMDIQAIQASLLHDTLEDCGIESNEIDALFGPEVTSLVEAVTKISVEGKLATKIITKNSEYEADLVINNADYHHGETQLLEEKHQTYKSNYWKKRTMAVSMHLAYIGVKRKINSLTHHNYFFNENWNEHFDQVFKTPKWPDNPNLYVCCPSRIDKDVAPENMENLFFLVPVAPDLDDSDSIREAYFDKVLEKFEKETGEKIKDDIVFKSLFTHRDFKERYNAYKGTGLGMAHTLWQTAVFRPKHKSSKVKNLYYTGQYNHPGVGVPTTVISSQILVDELNKKGVLT